MSAPQIPEAAVEAGMRGAFVVREEVSRGVLTAALPHLHRAWMEELIAKAEAQCAEAWAAFDKIPQHLKGFPDGQHQRTLGIQANNAHWWLRAELAEERGGE